MRDRRRPGCGEILVTAIIVGMVVTLCDNCRNEATAQTDEWKKWEEESKKIGAGQEAPPMPDKDLTPHEKWCQNVDGWCPTVRNGVLAGKRWCLPKKPGGNKPKCYYSHRKKTYEIYLVWKKWLDKYMGGKHGLYKANTIRTESEGVWDSKTPSKTKECGLASIDIYKAKQWNVNACDTKANLWLAGHMTNLRLTNLRETYPQIILAPLVDQWRLAGACGSIGSNKVANLIDSSGALRTNEDGTLYYAHPHDRILKWLMWKDQSDPDFFYTFDAISLLGRNPGRGAFRVARSVAADELIGTLLVDGPAALYGEPSLPKRPDDLYPFPGMNKHCQCWRWPELAERKPKPFTSDPQLIPEDEL